MFYDSALGRFVAEFFRGDAVCHLTMKSWSIDAMREVRARAPEVLAVLRKIGARHIYAYNAEGREEQKWLRFMGLFGFHEVRRANGWILVEVPSA